MEIDKKLIFNYSKEIIYYFLRVTIFIILNKFYFLCLVIWCLTCHFILNKIYPDLNVLKDSNIFINTTTFLIIEYLYVYLTSKICGIFKKLDKLNFIWSLLIVIIINILFYFNEDSNTDIKVFCNIGYFWKPLICFFIYKFFNLLTKKFPFPFGKIRYYTSIEFIRDLCLKIRKSIKNSNPQ